MVRAGSTLCWRHTLSLEYYFLVVSFHQGHLDCQQLLRLPRAFKEEEEEEDKSAHHWDAASSSWRTN